MAAISALIGVAVALFSHPEIELLLERGNLTGADTLRVAEIQGYFVLQLPFFLVSLILVRLLAALTLNRAVFAITAFNSVLNVALNYWLMQSMGVAGIALWSTLVHVLSILLLAVVAAARI